MGVAVALLGCGPRLEADRCTYGCADAGIAAGDAAISGLSSFDALFAAILDVTQATARSQAALRGELDAIAIGLELGPGSTGATIRAKLTERAAAATRDGLRMRYAPVVCASAEAIARRVYATCEADAAPWDAAITCAGACVIAADAQAICAAEAALSCVGVAPALACHGACTGACELSEAATCEGTCRGACDGECSVVDAQGACAGACAGACVGTCELVAGGPCAGACVGACVDAPAGESCGAGLEPRCEAAADAAIACRGRCDGEARAPTTVVECAVAVAGTTTAALECAPPTVELTWQWSDALIGDAAAQAEFRAWTGVLRRRLSGLLAAEAKATRLAAQAAAMAADTRGPVVDRLEAVEDGGSLLELIGAGCALDQVNDGVGLLEESAAALRDALGDAAPVLVAAGR
ncbi:MAG: hypothetical protein R3A79_05365 [Nannocystaceae bacterium]